MAPPADGAHFNMKRDGNSTRCAAKTPRWTNKDDASETDVYRVTLMPSMTSTSHRDVEELLWSHTRAVAAPAVDFTRLSSMSLDQWDTGIGRLKHKHDSLRAFTRKRTSPNTPATTEVLVTGELQCSVADVAALLRCPAEGDFNATMARIHGRSFERGAVVHSGTAGNQDEGDDLCPYQCVKTASFKHPRLALLDPHERWCFLEEFAPVSRDGFTLSQRSLRPDALPQAARPPIELVRRRRGLGLTRAKKHTRQLMGLSLGYSVETISGREPAAVRIVFYGCASSEDGDNADAVQRRVKLLARGVLKLPELVQRRQLNAQVPAGSLSTDRLTSKRLGPPASSQCAGCSRKFHKLLMIKKTRCYLCAQFVCWRCWTRQPLDTVNGRKIAVLVCPHCLDSIQSCNYAHQAASHVSGRGSGSSASTSSHGSGGDNGDSFRSAQVLPDANEAPEPGSAVVAYLAQILSDEIETEVASEPESIIDPSADAAKTRTAVNVVQELTSVLDGGNRVMAHCSDNNDDVSPELEPKSSTALHNLQARFAREVLPMEACILSNAATDTSTSVSCDPIPPNEAHRLEAITQEQLLSAKGSDELRLICELAAQELSCMASLVTIVGRTVLYVLASNSPLFQNAELPRENTLCQHLLMEGRPMLVQLPGTVERFCKMSLVVDYDIQFYAGFPIFSRDGLSVVGSLCCLDVQPREMTQSQYSTLLHLTRTASSILMPKCPKSRSLHNLHKRDNDLPPQIKITAGSEIKPMSPVAYKQIK